MARITLSFHLANQVAAIIADEGFDVLHFHEPLMPALPMTMLRMSATANVGTFHAFARSNVGYYYGRPLLQPYLAHLHRAIAVSERRCQHIEKHHLTGESFGCGNRTLSSAVHQERFINELAHRRSRLIRNSERKCSASARVFEYPVDVFTFARLRDADYQRALQI